MLMKVSISVPSVSEAQVRQYLEEADGWSQTKNVSGLEPEEWEYSFKNSSWRVLNFHGATNMIHRIASSERRDEFEVWRDITQVKMPRLG